MQIDDYILRTLMRDLVGHDRSPSAFLVYLYLWSEAAHHHRQSTPISYQQLAEETGLSKSAVQRGVARLRRRKLIKVTKATATATPEYQVLRPWDRGR